MRVQMTAKWLQKVRSEKISSESEYTDALLTAFGVRVYPARKGRRYNTLSWYVRTGRGSSHKRKTLGRYPDLGLAAARQKAFRIVGDVVEEDVECTVVELADRYLTYLEGRNKATVAEDRRMLQKDVIPRWGHRQARDITPSMVRRLQLEIAEGRRAPRSADYIVMVLSGMFRFGKTRHDLIEGHPNPAADIDKVHTAPKEERDLSWDEICRLWEACESVGSVGCRAFQLGVLTGLRRNALLGGRWSEVGKDALEPGTLWWEIPVERMLKGGFAIRLCLPPLTQQVLGKLPDQEFMFPSRRLGYRLHRVDKHQRKLRRLTGIGDLTYKMLRATFSSRLAELGVDEHIREALMGHTPRGMQGRHYNKYEYRAEKVEALNAYTSHLADELGIQPTASFRLHAVLKSA